MSSHSIYGLTIFYILIDASSIPEKNMQDKCFLTDDGHIYDHVSELNCELPQDIPDVGNEENFENYRDNPRSFPHSVLKLGTMMSQLNRN